MSIFNWRRWFRKRPKPRPLGRPPTTPLPRGPSLADLMVSTAATLRASTEDKQTRIDVKRYEPLPGVVPKDEVNRVAACDSTPYDYLNQAAYMGLAFQSWFPGYPILSQLAQKPEYRKITETIAKEMTRKWIKLKASGDEDKTDKLHELDEALKVFKVRDKFRMMAEHDGYFGRGQLYIDVRKPSGGLASEDPLELKTPLVTAPAKIKRGSLVGFRVVEPIWTYPGNYNSTNPLAKDFYKPSTWYVMGKTVHDSRLIMMISNPVPDVLKASYSFGGISMSQLAQPYVNNWLRTRDSVSDLVHNFSINGLLTDLETILNPDLAGDGGLLARAQLFNTLRDNKGLMMLNKETEEFFQFNVPLSGLDALQAQAQEQMASVSSIPLVKLLGITPNGLNASSDGEIRVFYDDIHAHQEDLFREPLQRVLDLVQLHIFGEIDPEITFDFEPLFQLSSLELANQHKVEADTDAVLIDAGVIQPDDALTRVAADPTTPYAGIDTTGNDDEDDELGQGNEADEADSADTARQGAAGR